MSGCLVILLVAVLLVLVNTLITTLQMSGFITSEGSYDWAKVVDPFKSFSGFVGNLPYDSLNTLNTADRFPLGNPMENFVSHIPKRTTVGNKKTGKSNFTNDFVSNNLAMSHFTSDSYQASDPYSPIDNGGVDLADIDNHMTFAKKVLSKRNSAREANYELQETPWIVQNANAIFRPTISTPAAAPTAAPPANGSGFMGMKSGFNTVPYMMSSA
jgi:hypothetical protein